MWDDAGAVALVKKDFDGAAAIFPIIERALVHIHADEFVGKPGLKVTGELHGVLERLRTMVERVLNAGAQRFADLRHRFLAQAAADGIAAKRQREPVLLHPPLSEVDDLVQSRLGEGEL